MKKNSYVLIILIIFSMFLSGCVGYSRALMATKTNVGLDIDNLPPTSEITIARRELAIQPSFPDITNSGNETLEPAFPLLASFGLEGGGEPKMLSMLNPSITGYFAGGDAAVYLAQEELEHGGKKDGATGDGNEGKNQMCLQSVPDVRSGFKRFLHWIASKDAKYVEMYNKDIFKKAEPFYFATDTSYGVKVAWNGTGGPYPDSLKLGYNRKEFASPPIMLNSNCGANGQKWCFKLPSFLASIDNASAFQEKDSSGVRHIQFFATGKAATEFSKRESVRQIAFAKMAPEAAKIDVMAFNQSLFNEIRKGVEKIDKDQLTAIIDEAIKRKLVPDDTAGKNNDQFLNVLKEAIKTPSHSTSLKLLYLLKALPPNPQ